eukprot:CAMPEP_0182419468 /NCGR_PEP_ID=MMETSP1167-20130531/3925_1 /TAXON_ID=2988 /ORGANISM="Mallomonas Sp, Strain CCMP3275" /LENGTH=681 /DNA_ID=CAMNT_0024594419 /DNA_START=529 /DNA_END=2574 /DNA_ORIENTATION=+
MEVDADRGLCGHIISTCAILNISDISKDDRFEIEKFIDPDTRSILGAPISLNTDEVVGIVFAFNKMMGNGSIFDFTPNEELDMGTIASNASLAIRRAHFFQKAMRQKRKSQALLSIVRARTSDETIENILDITIQATYELLLPERVSVYLCDHRKEEAWVCMSRDGYEGLTVKFGVGVAGSVAVTGKTIRIDNAYDDPRFFKDIDIDTGFRTRSMLCVAVPGFGTDSKPIAVIQVMNKVDGHRFDDDDEEALQDFCEEVSLAFRRKMLDMSLLKVARCKRVDQEPDEQNAAALEESLLKEYASVAQRSHYSTAVLQKRDSCRSNLSRPALRRMNSHRLDHLSSNEHEIYDSINRWDFDPLECSDAELMTYAEQMFVFHGLVDAYDIDREKLSSWIKAVHAGYRSINKFHNFTHAWSVMHITYQILRSGGAAYLTTLELFAALIVSFCHDLDHGGVSNAFEIASGGQLSYLYGDEAVLERHHVAETLRLLRIPENDILENLSFTDKLEMRRLINSGIMATDMAKHFDHVERLASLAKTTIDVTNPTDRIYLLGGMVHAADLSGQALKPELALKWADMVCDEFREQAQREVRLGLPLTPHMQGLELEITKLQLQFGFISNIVVPLWKALSELFPAVRHMAENAYANKLYYKDRVRAMTEGVPIKMNGRAHRRDSNVSDISELN